MHDRDVAVEPFLTWSFQSLSQGTIVLRDYELVQKGVQKDASLVDVVTGRNAVLRLFEMASDAGFSDAANFFYERYEFFCRWLLQVVEN